MHAAQLCAQSLYRKHSLIHALLHIKQQQMKQLSTLGLDRNLNAVPEFSQNC